MIRSLLALSLIAATAVLAQPYRSSISTVAVYATVQHQSGRVVANLTRNDFSILDNGRPVDITLFSSEPQPLTVVLMLDMSGSMVERFARVRSSTLEFINVLAPGDRVQIGTFGDEVAVSPLLTGDKSVLARVVDQELWPGGATPLWTALDAGMSALSGQSGRRVVLALTDGADACNLRKCVEYRDAHRRAVREDFMVYAIGMDHAGLGRPIITLAEDTGGGHFELETGADLTATFLRVAEELRQQYLLGFTPASLDGKLHELDVRVAQEGMKVRARRSYVAQAGRRAASSDHDVTASSLPAGLR